MRGQTRQGDFRQIKRIDPTILLQHFAGGILGTESAVEVGIVRNHIRAAHKLNQPRNSCVGIGRIGNIRIADVGKVSHLFRNRLARVHEGNVPTHNLAVHHARGGNLDKLIVVERKTRGFGIDNHHVFIKLAKRMLGSVFA